MIESTLNFTQTMLRPLSRYADFRGRASRLELCLFSGFVVVAIVAMGMFFGILAGLIGPSAGPGSFFSAIASVVIGTFLLGTLVPSLSVTVRRLHDQGRSGRFLLVLFIPAVGLFILAALLLLPGDNSANRYGPPSDSDAEIF